MKRIQKKIIKTFCISSFLAGIIFSGSALGAELNIELSEEYKKWDNLVLEEKEKTIMPKTYSQSVPEIFLEEKQRKEIPSLLNKINENLKFRNKKVNLQIFQPIIDLSDKK